MFKNEEGSDKILAINQYKDVFIIPLEVQLKIQFILQ